MLKLSKKDIARFWTKVDKSGGEDACWPWLASQDGRGYGQFTVKQLGLWKPIKAHRISCFLKYKVLSSCTCHHCDNPICCNPSHLYNGS